MGRVSDGKGGWVMHDLEHFDEEDDDEAGSTLGYLAHKARRW